MSAPTQGPEAILFSSAVRRVYFASTPSRVQKDDGEDGGTSRISRSNELSDEEQRAIAELKARDREVRAHEQAHLATAGQYARGGAHFTYQRGPDGRNYAIGGEVSIDTSGVPGDPQATLRKAQQVQRAALAPAEPSGQDRSVAAQAAAVAVQAQIEIARARQEEAAGNDDETAESNETRASAGAEIGQSAEPVEAATGDGDGDKQGPAAAGAVLASRPASARETAQLTDLLSIASGRQPGPGGLRQVA